MAPKGAHSTIVAEQQRFFRGFTARLSYQIGDARPGEYPSEGTARAAKKDQDRRFESTSSALERAFAHYADGEHPFKRFRDRLARNVELKEDPYPSKQLKTSPVRLGGIQLELYLKDKTDPAVAKKIVYDFLLSQAFKGGALRMKSPLTLRTDPNPFNLNLEWSAHDGWNLEAIVQAVIANPRLLPTVAEPKYQQPIRSFRARLLQRVLEEKTIGSELIEEGGKLGIDELASALWVLPDSAEKERKLISEKLDPSRRERFQPLF
jgi:hypothetical protein